MNLQRWSFCELSFGCCPLTEFKNIDVVWSDTPPQSNRTDADYSKNDRNRVVSDHLVLLAESEMGGYELEYNSIMKLEKVETDLGLAESREVWKLVYSYRPKELWGKSNAHDLKGKKWIFLTHANSHADFEYSSGKQALIDHSIPLNVQKAHISDYSKP